MSEPNTTPQVTMQQLVAPATGTGFGSAVSAAVLALLGLLLPFVSISTNMGTGLDQSGSFNGFAAASWVAWLALLIFVLAAASSRVTQLAPYRNILSLAGPVVSVITVLFGWFLSPAAAQFARSEPRALVGRLARQPDQYRTPYRHGRAARRWRTALLVEPQTGLRHRVRLRPQLVQHDQ
ncbi:hypothetical protein N8D56_15825 [Devosia sp. A8/3-2]|nr:hypothetical protein N8D56_15825 [Devosia sp. A8/3-2]